MNEIISRMLDIPYVKLHFKVIFDEDVFLPSNKAPGLRGGMGQMLLNSNCVVNPDAAFAERECGACRFQSECIVQRIMYSPFVYKPSFVTQGESIGFVLDCQDFNREYYAGNSLYFDMTLFGPTIVYFNQILQAFHMLGITGLGTNRGRFHIDRITSTDGQTLVENQMVDMSRYNIRTLSEYVTYRLRNGMQEKRMKFHTPAAITYMGIQISEFSPEAVIPSLCRRIYMLDCFTGIKVSQYAPGENMPVMKEQEARPIFTARHSERQGKKIPISGIKGYMDLDNINEDLYALLLAGEITHIGKNTKQGLGRYTLTDPNSQFRKEGKREK